MTDHHDTRRPCPECGYPTGCGADGHELPPPDDHPDDQGAVGWPPPDWPVVACAPPTDTTEPEGGRWATTYLPGRVDGVSVFVPNWYSGRTDHLAAVAVELDRTGGGAVPCSEQYRAIAFGYEYARTGNPPQAGGHGGDHRAHIAGYLSGFVVSGSEGGILAGAAAVVRLTDRLLADIVRRPADTEVGR